MIFHSTFSKPVLLVGNGIRSSGANDLLLKFINKTDIPVLTSMNGVDLVQDDLQLGFIGIHGNRVANMIISQCDLLISIGSRMGLRQVGKYPERFAPNAKIIRADIDEFELARSVHTDEEKFLIDAKEFLTMLLEEDIPKYTVWKNKCFEAKKLLDGYDNEIGNLVIKKISELLPNNPIVSVDVGQNQCWSAQSLRLRGNSGRIMIGGGYGSMGCSLPWAIGAANYLRSANKNDTVYCITGDGGLQMNIQELQTIYRENLSIKIIVMNNRILGKIWETQHKSHGDRLAQTAKEGGYTVPDFAKISKAYGIKSTTLSSYHELDDYKDWFYDNDPCLINVLLPPNTGLVPKINWVAGIMEPQLVEDITNEVLRILA